MERSANDQVKMRYIRLCCFFIWCYAWPETVSGQVSASSAEYGLYAAVDSGSSTIAQRTDSIRSNPGAEPDSLSDVALKKMDAQSIKEYLKGLKTVISDKYVFPARQKRYYKLAVLLARLKKYPLALKYFSYAKDTTEDHMPSERFGRDSLLLNLAGIIIPDSSVKNKEALFLLGNDTILLENRHSAAASKPVSLKKLLEPFKEEEEKDSYGIVLHIKQPVPGKRKQYALFNNVGHMFITLIKFDNEGGSVSRTFGFYPQKSNFLSATPLMPDASSTFKTDETHQWDQMIGKLISRKQFKLVLRMVHQYGKKRYHLNKNNCTDFGLCIAAICGIEIKDTRGSWPLGAGNNPGDTGQSVLEGKIGNTGNPEEPDLFILSDSN